MSHVALPPGVYAPIPTPFDEAGQVGPERLRSALTRWLRSPLKGFVVLGTTGEAALLDEAESDRTVGWARDTIPADRPLVVGTARESTQATIAASRRAAALGADAVIVRTPGFYKGRMTSAALVAHYQAVADASRVPVLLYNFTAVTGVSLAPAAVATLAAHPNITGIKESDGDVARIAELVAAVPSTFRVFAGSGSSFYASLAVGASGGILALACSMPTGCARIFDAVASGRHDEARRLQQRLAPLARLLGTGLGVAGLKAALTLQGFDVGQPRPPLRPVDASDRDTLAAVLADLEDISS